MNPLVILLSALAAGCAVPVTAPQDCERYGVKNTHDTRFVFEAKGLVQLDLNDKCQTADRPDGYEYAGCMTHNADGTVNLYWRVGDHYAREHEYAHALCGNQHTQRYSRDLINGHPCPYCPE